MLFSVLFRT